MVWLIAHRGGAALELENTQKAFSRALKEPVDGLECDIQVSRNGVPVLFHDRTLFKFNLKQHRLKQYTWEEIKKFKSQTYKNWRISGRSLMTYEQFLKSHVDTTKLFVEIKSRAGDRLDGTNYKCFEAMQKVHKNVKPDKKSTFFMSFDPELMQRVRREMKSYQVLQLSEKPELLKRKKLEGFYGVGLPLKKVNEGIVKKYHDWGLKVLVYTCNGPTQLARMKRAAVDIIVSDRPDWIRKKWETLP